MSERPLPVKQISFGRRKRWVAILELTADECESIAYALGMDDLGAQELLATAEHIRELEDPA